MEFSISYKADTGHFMEVRTQLGDRELRSRPLADLIDTVAFPALACIRDSMESKGQLARTFSPADPELE